jgi:hypothetical protein
MKNVQNVVARTAALLTLVVAGCAPAPERPLDSADQFAFKVARTPYSAAMCISKNAKARPGTAAEERTVGESGMEVVVRSSGATLAVARIERSGTFADVNVLVGKGVSGDRGAFARSLVAGC